LLSLEDLRVVVAVARHGSFVEAARRTRVPSSTVSRAVARFEAAAGVRLFQRTSRRMSLTDEGARLIEQASPLLDELGQVVDNLTGDAGVLSGRLRVTAPVVSGGGEVGAALIAFAEAHPRVIVELHLTNAVVDLVTDGFDLAFRAGPIVQGADLVAKRVASAPYAIGASPAFVRREIGRARRLSRADLEAVPAILARPGATWRFQRADGTRTEVRPRGHFCVTDPRVAIGAAVRGLGMVRAPREWIVAAALRVLEPSADVGVPEPRDLFAVYPSRHLVPKRVAAAVAWVERALRTRQRPK
jgi:LysR family transcriptional regulator, transcriptional activator AphB